MLTLLFQHEKIRDAEVAPFMQVHLSKGLLHMSRITFKIHRKGLKSV